MKTLMIIISVFASINLVSAQNQNELVYNSDENTYLLNSPYSFGSDADVLILPVNNNYGSVVRNLTTGAYTNYGDVFVPFEENHNTGEESSDKNASDKTVVSENDDWNYDVTYPEGAQLTAEEGKEYDTIYFAPFAEFEDQGDVVRKTLTSTVDYTTLYVPKDETEKQSEIFADVSLEKVEPKKISSSNSEANIEGMLQDIDMNQVSNVGYVSPTINGKILVITEEDGYRYFDDKEIVGDNEIVNEIEESGKPISELTFYYMMIDYHILSQDDISANDFLKMEIEEQINLVSPLLNGYANR